MKQFCRFQLAIAPCGSVDGIVQSDRRASPHVKAYLNIKPRRQRRYLPLKNTPKTPTEVFPQKVLKTLRTQSLINVVLAVSPRIHWGSFKGIPTGTQFTYKYLVIFNQDRVWHYILQLPKKIIRNTDITFRCNAGQQKLINAIIQFGNVFQWYLFIYYCCADVCSPLSNYFSRKLAIYHSHQLQIANGNILLSCKNEILSEFKLALYEKYIK